MYEELRSRAEMIGQRHGKNAAGWTYDGNTPDTWYAWMLKGIDVGDPMVLESVREPSLSGEYGDDYSDADLFEEVEATELECDEAQDEIADAYITAARMAFWDAIETACRRHLESVTDRENREAGYIVF